MTKEKNVHSILDSIYKIKDSLQDRAYLRAR